MKYYYLIKIQFLGFRYHGWQKQSNISTLQGTVENALKKVISKSTFQIISASRTDSMVSALEHYFEIITDMIIDEFHFTEKINRVLPPDITILSIKEVSHDFVIINQSKMKEYNYLFSFGGKGHPFSAPYLSHFNEILNIEDMIVAAPCFEGEHWFKNYCYRPRETQVFKREVIESRIEVNTKFSANFFPEKSYLYKVRAKSFMRHQIRLMMGALLRIGLGQLTLSELENSLKKGSDHIQLIAPASGLILSKVEMESRAE